MRWIVPLALALAPLPALHAASPDRMSYMLVTANGHSTSTTINGSSDDFRAVQSYRSGNVPVLYVRQSGVGYLIRDPAILARAEAIMAPQQELGRRQGELGRQQGELGRRQGELGAQQGRLGTMMSNVRVRELGDLGRQQDALGRQQAAFGAQQSALGERQAELGRQQSRLAEQSKPQIRALVDEAIRRGVAQRTN